MILFFFLPGERKIIGYTWQEKAPDLSFFGWPWVCEWTESDIGYVFAGFHFGLAWDKFIATKAVAELHSHGFIHKVGAAGDCLLLLSMMGLDLEGFFLYDFMLHFQTLGLKSPPGIGKPNLALQFAAVPALEKRAESVVKCC